MITTTTIKVVQKIKEDCIYLTARRTDREIIQLVSFLKPYTNQGMKIKKVHYTISTGVLKVKLSINTNTATA